CSTPPWPASERALPGATSTRLRRRLRSTGVRGWLRSPAGVRGCRIRRHRRLEQRILEMTEQYPTYSYLRISQQLRLIGVGVSPFVSRGGRWDSNLTLSAVPTDRARTLRRLHSMADRKSTRLNSSH